MKAYVIQYDLLSTNLFFALQIQWENTYTWEWQNIRKLINGARVSLRATYAQSTFTVFFERSKKQTAPHTNRLRGARETLKCMFFPAGVPCTPPPLQYWYGLQGYTNDMNQIHGNINSHVVHFCTCKSLFDQITCQLWSQSVNTAASWLHVCMIGLSGPQEPQYALEHPSCRQCRETPYT